MPQTTIEAGALATLLGTPRFRRSERCYRATVRVLEIRKHTARIEAQRRDGTIKRRFVKLDRLIAGAHWTW